MHEPGAHVLEGLSAPGIEPKMVETAAPTHGGVALGLGRAWHLADMERPLTTQSQHHHVFPDMASMMAKVVRHVRLTHRLAEAHASVQVPRQEGNMVDPVSQGCHAESPPSARRRCAGVLRVGDYACCRTHGSAMAGLQSAPVLGLHGLTPIACHGGVDILS